MTTWFSKSLWCILLAPLASLVVPLRAQAQITSGVSVQVYAGLTITGVVGSNYVVQYVTDLSQTNNWQLLTNLILPSNPYLWFDASCPATPRRLYRVLAPTSTNPNPVELVWIPPGTFVMGSPTSEVDRSSDEGPQTTVTLTKGFFMGRYLVTQRDYVAVMTNNPSYITGSLDLPVESVAWVGATNYCGNLTRQEQAAGRLPTGWVYRLPTEAEWEYACRAGTTNRFSYGDDPGYTQLINYAWYTANSGSATHRVGQKVPNPLGLYDTYGNVEELCLDWYAGYPGGSVTNPTGSDNGLYRVARGGALNSSAKNCRSADRSTAHPSSGCFWQGFRVVLAQGQP
jgi:formylglycine-generating enzyme required for sulfatase activity